MIQCTGPNMAWGCSIRWALVDHIWQPFNMVLLISVRFHAPTRWTQKLKLLGRGGKSTNTPQRSHSHAAGTNRKCENKEGSGGLKRCLYQDFLYQGSNSRPLALITMLGFMHQPDEPKSLSCWKEVGNPLILHNTAQLGQAAVARGGVEVIRGWRCYQDAR